MGQVGSLLSMKTVHLDPDARECVSLVVDEIERLLGAGKHIAVTVAEEQELLSPSRRQTVSASPVRTSCS